MSILKRLIALANHLDNINFFQEASELDKVIVRFAMSMDDARALLGVPPNASEEEIQKAWRAKAVMWHPDKPTGDLAKMQEINVARDILLGERGPDKTFSPSSPPPPADYPFRTKPSEPNIRTWESAVSEANIPEGVNWKLKTSTAYDRVGMSGNASAFVVYGTTEDSHVFVGVYHFEEHNIAGSTDTYDVWSETYPKSANLADLAPAAIRALWSKFPNVRDYNAKVVILPEGTALKPFMGSSGDRTISFKDAMAILGETPTTYDSKKKVDIVMELGYPPKGAGMSDYSVTLVVNGRPYKLSDENSAKISKMRKLLGAVFGAYYYADSKKNITRQPADKRKVILKFLAENLASTEPSELIDALKKGAEQ